MMAGLSEAEAAFRCGSRIDLAFRNSTHWALTAEIIQ